MPGGVLASMTGFASATGAGLGAAPAPGMAAVGLHNALFLAFLGASLAQPGMVKGLTAATAETDPLRGIFFAMTFFTIGMASDLKRLWAEGIGRLALVYAVSLFGFIIWIGLAISWLFFHGAHPPIISGGH